MALDTYDRPWREAFCYIRKNLNNVREINHLDRGASYCKKKMLSQVLLLVFVFPTTAYLFWPSPNSERKFSIPSTPRQWSAEILKKFPPCHLVVDRTTRGLVGTSIIETAAETLAYPLVDWSADEVVSLITSGLRIDETDRDKPTHVIVRGAGGGKTRCLEEIRREIMLNIDRCLPVAITFTEPTRLGCTEFPVGNTPVPQRVHRSAALSVAARMVHAVARGDAWFIIQSIMDAECELNEIATGKDIIAGMADAILDSVNEKYNAQLDSIVLLLDGAKKLSDQVSASFPGCPGTEDVLSPVKRGMRAVGRSVVISSLTPRILGPTKLSWGIDALVLPAAYNTSAVVDRWWGIPRNCAYYHQYYVLASAIHTLPRALEICAAEIDELRHQIDRPEALATVLREVRSGLTQVYRGYLGPQVLYNAVFRRECALSPDTLDAIRHSIYTNSLSGTELDLAHSTICPEASPLMLGLFWTVPPRGTRQEDTGGEDILHIIQRAVLPPSPAVEPTEDLLRDVAFPRWLLVRLKAARDASEALTVEELLGLGDTLIPALQCPIDLSGHLPLNIRMLAAGSWENGGQALLREVDSIAIHSNHPIRVLKCAPGEAADCVLLVHNPAAPGGKSIIWVNAGAAHEPGVTAGSANEWLELGSTSDCPQGRRQFEQIAKLMGSDRSFAYVYFTTDSVYRYQLSDRGLVYTGRAEAERFYGPLMDLVDAVQSEP